MSCLSCMHLATKPKPPTPPDTEAAGANDRDQRSRTAVSSRNMTQSGSMSHSGLTFAIAKAPASLALAGNDIRCRDGRPTTPEFPCSMTRAKGRTRSLHGPSVSGKYLMICTFESMLVVGAEEVRASPSLGALCMDGAKPQYPRFGLLSTGTASPHPARVSGSASASRSRVFKHTSPPAHPFRV